MNIRRVSDIYYYFDYISCELKDSKLFHVITSSILLHIPSYLSLPVLFSSLYSGQGLSLCDRAVQINEGSRNRRQSSLSGHRFSVRSGHGAD